MRFLASNNREKWILVGSTWRQRIQPINGVDRDFHRSIKRHVMNACPKNVKSLKTHRFPIGNKPFSTKVQIHLLDRRTSKPIRQWTTINMNFKFISSSWIESRLSKRQVTNRVALKIVDAISSWKGIKYWAAFRLNEGDEKELFFVLGNSFPFHWENDFLKDMVYPFASALKGIGLVSQSLLWSWKYWIDHGLVNKTTVVPTESFASIDWLGRSNFCWRGSISTPAFGRIQSTCFQDSISTRHSAPYSLSKRNFKTSYWRGPTAPNKGTRWTLPVISKACATPSSATDRVLLENAYILRYSYYTRTQNIRAQSAEFLELDPCLLT